MDIAEFLKLRLDELERMARTPNLGAVSGDGLVTVERMYGGPVVIMDAATVLADVAAKRRIVERFEATEEWENEQWCELDYVLCALASVYADHDDWRPEWDVS